MPISILQSRILWTIIIFIFIQETLYSQFLETFEDNPSTEWRTPTGDGKAESDIKFYDGFAELTINATNDDRNIWWAIMQTTVTDYLNLEKLSDQAYEIRMEARVRTSHAPKRVNLHLNTQRTTDFHTHLMEFDIPDTSNWHIISMTTTDFDGRPGDTINGHIALMDWGNEVYKLYVDYFKVNVVNKDEAKPDIGEQVLYPPPNPLPEQFTYSEHVTEAAMIDKQFPKANLSNWKAVDMPVLTTDGTKTIILRWNLENYYGQKVSGYGMLELIPHSSFFTQDTDLLEFDQIRLVEILDGNSEWTRETVTYENFTAGKSIEAVLNTQMIIDIDSPEEMNKPLNIHIPRPVIQRMVDGVTLGIALYPLGSVNASFYLGENSKDYGSSRLYFNLDK